MDGAKRSQLAIEAKRRWTARSEVNGQVAIEAKRRWTARSEVNWQSKRSADGRREAKSIGSGRKVVL